MERAGVWKLVVLVLIILCECQAALPDPSSNAEGEVYYTSVCEGKAMDLKCYHGRVIIIESANFGRTDDQTCQGHGPTHNTNCEEPSSFSIVSQMCNDKAECSFRASSFLFGDPCPGTFKYLEVVYECIENVNPPTTVATTTPSERITTVSSTATTLGNWTSPRPPTNEPATTATMKMTTKVKPTEPPPPAVVGKCPATILRGISWPSTTAGVTVARPCPEGSKGMTYWECLGEPGSVVAWGPGPNLTDCQSEWVSDVTDLAAKGANTTVVSSAIVEEIERTDVIYGSDIQAVSTYMSESIVTFEEDLEGLEEEAKFEESLQVSQNYLEITSAILDNNNIASWNDMTEVDRTTSASSILSSLEESAFLLAETIEPTTNAEEVTVTKEENNVLMTIMVQDVSHGNSIDAVFPPKHSVATSKWGGIEDQITIPRENFDLTSESGTSKVVFLAYNNIHDYLGYYPPKTKPKTSAFVNSRIMSASLNSAEKRTNLKAPVTISFAHIEVNATNPSCSFWDFKNSSYGDWSDEGCKVIHTNSTHTVCSCNHLTNFAILMDVQAVELTQTHTFALSVITYFGFIISCICLLLAFITFCMFKNLQSDRTTIHKNLCLTLLIAEVIFMAGISQTKQMLVCSIIAMLLHYFFLCAFAWMCLEGIQLYVMLVEVFEAESSRRKYYYPFGYGLPAIVVGVSAAINFDGYGTDTYCWLSTDDNFIWAFVAPVCLIIVVNTIFLTMAMYIMCRHSKLQTNPKEKKAGEKITEDQMYTPTDKLIVGSTRMEYFASWMRGALVLLCLLGITWVFGLAYVNANFVVFAYIFTVFNALQGMFIFIFHCLMNDKVRKEYRRYVRNSTWIPECIRDNYGGIFSSNSNQQQSFRSSSSGRVRTGVSHESKRFSNTTGSYNFDQRKNSCSSGCRCSGEYLPINSPPPDGDRIESFEYEEVPDSFIPTLQVAVEADRASREESGVHDEGIGLELEGHPQWSDKPSIVVDNAAGDLARFSKTDLMASSKEGLQREYQPLLRESGIVNDSQLSSPVGDNLPAISYRVQRSDPELANIKPLLSLKGDRSPVHRESGIGGSHSESGRSSTSSEHMCPRSPVDTPDEPVKAYIYPNPSFGVPNHTSMPDLAHAKHGRRAQFNEVPSNLNFSSLPKKSHSSAGVGEPQAKRTYSYSSDTRANYGSNPEAELYVPQATSRLETLI